MARIRRTVRPRHILATAAAVALLIVGAPAPARADLPPAFTEKDCSQDAEKKATLVCAKTVPPSDTARYRNNARSTSPDKIAGQLKASADTIDECRNNPYYWKIVSRREACQYRLIDVVLLNAQTRAVEGTAVFEATNYALVQNGQTTWTERVTVSIKSYTQTGASTSHDVGLACLGQCGGPSADPGSKGPGVPTVADFTMTGTLGAPLPSVAYANTVTTIQFWTPTSTVAMVDNTGQGAHEVRCDSFTNYFGVSGCVFPAFTPTVSWSYDHPEFWEVAQHIRDAQRAGRPGAPGTSPLHRTWEEDRQKKNRDTACPSSFPTGDGQSCDEYPFASTREGAANNPYSARAVNDVHNSRHGTALNVELYAPERIMDGDAFYVAITGTPDRSTIMTVGDSITQGLEGDYTWRYRLKQHLDAASTPVDFVGPYSGTNRIPDSQPDNYPTSSAPITFSGTYRDNLSFDSQHFAQWGRQANQAKWDINGMTGRYKPEYIFLALGFNDLGWQASTPDQLVATIQEIITNARWAKGDVKFLIANVVHRTPLVNVPNLNATITEYNSKLGPALQAMDTLHSPVRLVDMDTGYSPTNDTYDGLHPNSVGEYKIARAFANTLSSKFGVGRDFGTIPTSVSTLTPSRPTYINAQSFDGGIRVSWNHSYGAEGYWLYQRNATLNQAFEKLPLLIPADSWKLSWVTTGQKYEYYVVPARGSSLGQASPTASVVANPKTARGPEAVVPSATARYIDLSWQKPTGIGSDTVSSYKIYYKDESVPGSIADTLTTTSRSARLNNLITGHTYAIAISSINAAGEGSPTYVPPVTAVTGG